MNCGDIFCDNNKKWCIIAIAFIITSYVVAFVVLFLITPTPILRLESASVSHLNYSTSPTPFFSLTMNGRLSLENREFGRFDYHASKNVTVLYENFIIGDGVVSDGTVKGRRTKEIYVTLNLSSENIHVLPSDTIASGSLNLTISTELRGTKHALFVFKKRRTLKLACTFRLNFTSSSINHIQCP